MLLSTLPDLPGRTYDTRGVVFDCGYPEPTRILGAGVTHGLRGLFDTLIKQASDMGADAIIDIKVTACGGSTTVVVTGTAVKLL